MPPPGSPAFLLRAAVIARPRGAEPQARHRRPGAAAAPSTSSHCRPGASPPLEARTASSSWTASLPRATTPSRCRPTRSAPCPRCSDSPPRRAVVLEPAGEQNRKAPPLPHPSCDRPSSRCCRPVAKEPSLCAGLRAEFFLQEPSVPRALLDTHAQTEPLIRPASYVIDEMPKPFGHVCPAPLCAARHRLCVPAFVPRFSCRCRPPSCR